VLCFRCATRWPECSVQRQRVCAICLLWTKSTEGWWLESVSSRAEGRNETRWLWVRLDALRLLRSEVALSLDFSFPDSCTPFNSPKVKTMKKWPPVEAIACLDCRFSTSSPLNGEGIAFIYRFSPQHLYSIASHSPIHTPTALSTMQRNHQPVRSR